MIKLTTVGFAAFAIVFYIQDGACEPSSEASPATHHHCMFNPCYNGGTCEVVGSTAMCLCPVGYTGVTCQAIATGTSPTSQTTVSTTDILSPASDMSCTFNPCKNGATCTVDQNGLYTCLCSAGYTGVTCETVMSTASTTSKALCAFNPCNNGGTCEIIGNSYQCVCDAGYTGVVCEKQIPQTLANTLGKAGCGRVEVVFLVERSEDDSRSDVDHQADLIRNLVRGWNTTNYGVRIGVVTYAEHVRKYIGLGDYASKAELISKLHRLQSSLGEAEEDTSVTEAMDYAREHVLDTSRTGANKIVVAIIHEMTGKSRRYFEQASQRLKDRGITLYSLAVKARNDDKTKIQSNSDYFFTYSDFNALENAIPYTGFAPCK